MVHDHPELPGWLAMHDTGFQGGINMAAAFFTDNLVTEHARLFEVPECIIGGDDL